MVIVTEMLMLEHQWVVEVVCRKIRRKEKEVCV